MFDNFDTNIKENVPVEVMVSRAWSTWDPSTVTGSDNPKLYYENRDSKPVLTENDTITLSVTDNVQFFLDEGINYGFMVGRKLFKGWTVKFYSSEATNVAVRPSLTIIYADSGATAITNPIDLSGKSSSSSIQSIGKNIFNVMMSTADLVTFDIYTLKGQMVYSSKEFQLSVGISSLNLPLGLLSNGSYIVNVHGQKTKMNKLFIYN